MYGTRRGNPALTELINIPLNTSARGLLLSPLMLMETITPSRPMQRDRHKVGTAAFPILTTVLFGF